MPRTEPAPRLACATYKHHSDVVVGGADSSGLATDLATAGPLQKACRDAGLPYSAQTLQYLEDVAVRAKLSDGMTTTPKQLRQAARLHRKVAANPTRWAPDVQLTHSAAKKQVMAANGITSGRQWKKWKKQQQRELRAEMQGGVDAD